MAIVWLDLLTAAAGGGGFVKGLDYLYSEYTRRSTASQSAKVVVEKHLDPILKSADELVGKIRSLAQKDFKEITVNNSDEKSFGEHNIPTTSILYLIGQFWARVQILRKESIYMDLGASVIGSNLQSFIYTLESNRIRIVDRAWQRGIGESLICYRGNEQDIFTFYEFLGKYNSDSSFRAWFLPIQKQLEKINHKKNRQCFLLYGAILHSMLDTLDPLHRVARKRPGWANKLSKKSRRELQHRVFGVYLPFVSNPHLYCR